MRMTGFIAGGVLGMVGAFALMKRKPGMAKAMQNVMGDMKGNMMTMAASKFTSSKQQGEQQSNTPQAATSSQSAQSANKAKSSSNTPSNHQMNVSMIEGIIKNDPELQSAVNEIKNESKSIQH